MSRFATAARVWSAWLFLVAFVLALVGWSPAMAQETPVAEPYVVRVEEDWELITGDPDPNVDAPQIVCVISPQGNVNSVHAAFELNARSLPVFEAGGMQLQVWEGDATLSDHAHPLGEQMQQASETVTWTQSITLNSNAEGAKSLTFEITNGTSASWGNFGGQGYLTETVNTNLENLDGYTPDVSVANSGVSYAGNRVQSLKLKAVRVHLSDEQVLTDNTERVVHTQGEF